MTQSSSANAQPADTQPDLSRQIELEIEQATDEQARCTRVFGDCYRCNFWSSSGGSFYENPSFAWGLPATHHIRRSVFLRATVHQGQLTITLVPPPN